MSQFCRLMRIGCIENMSEAVLSIQYGIHCLAHMWLNPSLS